MEDELYHYGVKGMKWGVRKSVQAWTKPSAISRNRARADIHTRKSKTARTQYMRDYHAGKAIRLNRKADNVSARFKGDKARARSIKKERIVRSMFQSTVEEGRAARYEKEGNSKAKSVLKSKGAQFGYNVAMGVGQAAAAAVAVGVASAIVKNRSRNSRPGLPSPGLPAGR